MLIARELDPISSIIARDVAAVHYYRRDYEAALEQCDRTIELNPHFSPGYWMLGLVQEQMGDLDESAAALQRAVELTPHSVRMHAALGRLFALSGKEREARAVLKQLRGQSQNRYVSPFDLASICIALGQTDEGLDLLAKAAADRSFELTFAQVDPRFDVVRANPRFADLISQIGVVAAWA
jgi:serine/threonine-protein kinase